MSATAVAKPYWWEAAPPPDLPEIPVQTTCDLLIVGAGYAGLTAALVAARAGLSVQVFDRQRPGEGASTRNGGIASGNLQISLSKMIKSIGTERAVEIYSEGARARQALPAFLQEENIDCDFKLVGRFTGAMNPEDYEALGKETDLINKHLNIGAYMVDAAGQHQEIGTDYYTGGQVRPDLGGLHPAKFHAGLVEKVVAAGVLVHGETAVSGIRREAAGFSVQTVRGGVRATDVLVTTNGYTDGVDKWLRRRLVPVPSRMIATEPLEPVLMDRLMPKRRMLGETSRLYHYYRPSPDGTRILFGGREGSFEDGSTAYAGKLKSDLDRIFPELGAIGLSHSWSGYVAFNLDFLPRLFVRDGVHYAVGFCGSGVIWAWWLGRQVGLRLIGDETSGSALDCKPPMPIPLYAGKPWFLPLSIAWFGLQDRLRGRSS